MGDGLCPDGLGTAAGAGAGIGGGAGAACSTARLFLCVCPSLRASARVGRTWNIPTTPAVVTTTAAVRIATPTFARTRIVFFCSVNRITRSSRTPSLNNPIPCAAANGTPASSILRASASRLRAYTISDPIASAAIPSHTTSRVCRIRCPIHRIAGCHTTGSDPSSHTSCVTQSRRSACASSCSNAARTSSRPCSQNPSGTSSLGRASPTSTGLNTAPDCLTSGSTRPATLPYASHSCRAHSGIADAHAPATSRLATNHPRTIRTIPRHNPAPYNTAKPRAAIVPSFGATSVRFIHNGTAQAPRPARFNSGTTSRAESAGKASASDPFGITAISCASSMSSPPSVPASRILTALVAAAGCTTAGCTT